MNKKVVAVRVSEKSYRYLQHLARSAAFFKQLKFYRLRCNWTETLAVEAYYFCYAFGKGQAIELARIAYAQIREFQPDGLMYRRIK